MIVLNYFAEVNYHVGLAEDIFYVMSDFLDMRNSMGVTCSGVFDPL